MAIVNILQHMWHNYYIPVVVFCSAHASNALTFIISLAYFWLRRKTYNCCKVNNLHTCTHINTHKHTYAYYTDRQTDRHTCISRCITTSNMCSDKLRKSRDRNIFSALPSAYCNTYNEKIHQCVTVHVH